MKINFEQAKQIEKFMDITYQQLAVPYYVTYDYLSDILKSANEIGVELNKLEETGAFVRPLYDRLHLLRKDKFANQQALENYDRFDAFYQTAVAREIQSFEIK